MAPARARPDAPGAAPSVHTRAGPRTNDAIHAPARGRGIERPTEPAALVAGFDPEDRCRTYLERLRWPTGVTCPRCDASDGISRIETRGQFDCGACGYQFSVRAGTILHASHLPLWKWFLAVDVMVGSTNGVSANRLKELLGVSYKTAWFLSHRIRAAMKEEPGRPTIGSHAQELGPRPDVSVKHLPRYQDEMAFRLNNRGNPDRFREVLLRLVRADSMSYADLIASA